MKRRKPIFTAGITLTVLFAFALVFAVALTILSVALTLIADSQILVDMFGAIAKYFISLDDLSIVVCASIDVALIISIVCSTRFIKYSSERNNKFNEKKLMLIISSIWIIIDIAAQVYVFVETMDFSNALMITVAQIVLIAIEVLCVILALVSIAKEPAFGSDLKKEQSQAKVFESRPSIYTSGLDESETPQKEEKTETVVEQKVELKESSASKQLVDAIGQLDKMRKEGAITSTEYTRLRGQLIRKYVK